MDSSREHFVEISLDSVLRKATRLESSLRSCTAKASSSTNLSSSGPAPPRPSLVQPPGSGGYGSVPPFPRGPVPDSTELSGEWQKLTAYIVSLEKEVQYYKQLLQDVKSQRGGSALDTQTAMGPGRGEREDNGGTSAGQRGPLSTGYWRDLLDKDPESRALVLVFSFLPAGELFRAALVCRKWYRASRHPRLWKEVVMSDVMLEPQVSFLGHACSQQGGVVILLLNLASGAVQHGRVVLQYRETGVAW